MANSSTFRLRCPQCQDVIEAAVIDMLGQKAFAECPYCGIKVELAEVKDSPVVSHWEVKSVTEVAEIAQ